MLEELLLHPQAAFVVAVFVGLLLVVVGLEVYSGVHTARQQFHRRSP